METTNEVVIKAADVPAVKSQIRTIAEGVWHPIHDIIVPEDARPVSPEGLDSLAADMNRQGQLESALLIRQADGTYKLVFGHRRLAAAKKIRWEKLKVDIKENVSESERLQMILSENGEREDASPFYVARLYGKIMELEHLSPEQLPEFLKKDRSTVYRVLSVAKLPVEVESMSRRRDMGLYHLVEIAKLPKPEEQVQLAQECAEKDYSVRELQARVKQLLNPGQASQAGPKPVELGLHFSWKGEQLVIRGALNANHGPATLAEEMKEALNQFMEDHPRPEPKEKEVAQAA